MRTLNIACATIGAAALIVLAVNAACPTPPPIGEVYPTVPVESTPVVDAEPAEHPDIVLVPCPVEDAVIDCYWDAATMGNGQGTSFVVIDGVVYRAEG